MRVFISYSPSDEDLKQELLTYLTPAVRAGVLAPWDASQVRAGDAQSVVIEAELGRAEVGLVLLSAHYLGPGGPAERDLEQLSARRSADQLRLVPILLSSCHWQEEPHLKDLQVLPRDGRPIRAQRDRAEAWVRVCRELVALAQTAPERATPAPATHRKAQGEVAPPAALNVRDAGSLMSAAVAAVPVMKYALAVAGLAAVVAIVTRGLGLDAVTATVGALVVVALMAVLIVLAAAAQNSRRLVLPATVLTWAVLLLTLGSSALLLGSLFFRWPRPLTCLVHQASCEPVQRGVSEQSVPIAKAGSVGAGIAAGAPLAPPETRSVEVNSDNAIDDSPGAAMHNRAAPPATKGPLRLNSGNRITKSGGAKVDNSIQVTQ